MKNLNIEGQFLKKKEKERKKRLKNSERIELRNLMTQSKKQQQQKHTSKNIILKKRTF